MDFYFWSSLKDDVYKNRYDIIKELELVIRNIIRSIDGRTVLKDIRQIFIRA